MKWLHYLKGALSREKPDDAVGRGSLAVSLRRRLPFFWPYLRRRGPIGAAWLFLSLAAFLVMYPRPLIYRFIIDRVLLAKELQLLAGALALYAFLALAGKLCSLAKNYYATLFQNHVEVDIQASLFERVLLFPRSFFDTRTTGYIMSRLTDDVGEMSSFFTGYLGYAAMQLLALAGGALALFYLNWKLALVCLVLLPLLFACTRFFMGRSRILGHHVMERGARVDSRLQESLSASTLIKSFASEEEEAGKLRRDLDRTRDASIESSVFNSLAGVSISSMGGLAGLMVLGFGGYLVIKGEWSLGSLLAFQGYLSYVLTPARDLSYSFITLQSSLAALERVSDLMLMVPEEEEGKGIMAQALKGSIDFDHVSFGYGPGSLVLKDLSFSLPAGGKIAIMGPSGAGKTTLLMLLLRFYEPREGSILLDGRPLSGYQARSLRERMGYVSQNIHLLSGTLLENIRYGNRLAGDDEVKEAASTAGIGGFIESLPHGFGTKVEELGKNFSEGQKQRISIARVLLKKPDIVILDEPTSALDGITEKSIVEALPGALRDKTLIIVAHRVATAMAADTVLVLREGELVDRGGHGELLERCALYRDMVGSQGG